MQHKCEWLGTLSQETTHVNDDCLYTKVPCEHAGCEWIGARLQHAAHRQTDCRAVPCRHHNEVCNCVSFYCLSLNALSKYNCDWVGTASDESKHVENDCQFTNVACENKVRQCNWRGQRLSMKSHLQKQCKKISCRHEEKVFELSNFNCSFIFC